MVYLWATLLCVMNVTAWASTLFMLPGNWLILVLCVAYRLAIPESTHPRLSWEMIAIAFLLAAAGELIELFAGAAGAKREGGTRRGAIISIAGSVVGSLVGAGAGIPIPILGPVIGALLGAVAGAFLGAYLGERRITHERRFAIGRGAAWGRLWGTFGKLACGAVMVVLLTLDSFWDLS